MDNDFEVIFIVLDKLLSVINYIEKYFEKEKTVKQVEMENLYTIYEDEEEEEEEDENGKYKKFINYIEDGFIIV
jgi:hypothetical protein